MKNTTDSSIEPNSMTPQREFGFLAVSMLLGVGCVFAAYDLYAGLDGYGGLSSYYMNQTVTGMIIGGIAIGWIFDVSVKNPETRRTLQKRLWELLFIGVFLFWLFRPALHNARA
jgi:hypothetical protein